MMVAQDARCQLASTTLVAAARSHFRCFPVDLRNSFHFVGVYNCTIDHGASERFDPRATSEPVRLPPSPDDGASAFIADGHDAIADRVCRPPTVDDEGQARAPATVEPRGITAELHVGTRGEEAAAARRQPLDKWPVWMSSRKAVNDDTNAEAYGAQPRELSEGRARSD